MSLQSPCLVASVVTPVTLEKRYPLSHRSNWATPSLTEEREREKNIPITNSQKLLKSKITLERERRIVSLLVQIPPQTWPKDISEY